VNYASCSRIPPHRKSLNCTTNPICLTVTIRTPISSAPISTTPARTSKTIWFIAPPPACFSTPTAKCANVSSTSTSRRVCECPSANLLIDKLGLACLRSRFPQAVLSSSFDPNFAFCISQGCILIFTVYFITIVSFNILLLLIIKFFTLLYGFWGKFDRQKVYSENIFVVVLWQFLNKPLYCDLFEVICVHGKNSYPR